MRAILDTIEATTATTSFPTWRLRDWLEERAARGDRADRSLAAAGHPCRRRLRRSARTVSESRRWLHF